MASTLIGAVQNAKRTEGLITNPANNSTTDLIRIKGPGLFISAEISKQGGVSGMTAIEVFLDGNEITSTYFVAYTNSGLTVPNNYGFQLCKSAQMETLTIGFPVAFTFNRELIIRATVKETGVVQIVANTICAS